MIRIVMTTVEDRLAALGISLPEPVAPVANYVPFVRSGSLVHISGQISIDAEGGIKGVVGEDVDLARGAADFGAGPFGEPGRHARSAVGVYRLPLNFAVEVDAVVEIA